MHVWVGSLGVDCLTRAAKKKNETFCDLPDYIISIKAARVFRAALYYA